MKTHDHFVYLLMRSFLWVLAILAVSAGFVGLVTGGFYGLTQIEGLGSVLLLVGGFVALRVFAAAAKRKRAVLREPERSVVIALCVLSFASLGIAFDQPGNRIYNAPLAWLFCPTGSQLSRSSLVSNPRAGTVVISQDFTCQANGQVVQKIDMAWVMLVRVLEYILLGYLLLGLHLLLERLNVQKL